jgi:hypothetical protein
MWNALKNTQGHIPLDVALYLFLPMKWYWRWFTQ